MMAPLAPAKKGPGPTTTTTQQQQQSQWRFNSPTTPSALFPSPSSKPAASFPSPSAPVPPSPSAWTPAPAPAPFVAPAPAPAPAAPPSQSPWTPSSAWKPAAAPSPSLSTPAMPAAANSLNAPLGSRLTFGAGGAGSQLGTGLLHHVQQQPTRVPDGKVIRLAWVAAPSNGAQVATQSGGAGGASQPQPELLDAEIVLRSSGNSSAAAAGGASAAAGGASAAGGSAAGGSGGRLLSEVRKQIEEQVVPELPVLQGGFRFMTATAVSIKAGQEVQRDISSCVVQHPAAGTIVVLCPTAAAAGAAAAAGKTQHIKQASGCGTASGTQPFCNLGHAMVKQAVDLTKPSIYQFNGWACDGCRREGGVAERWCCEVCTVDYCFSCFPRDTAVATAAAGAAAKPAAAPDAAAGMGPPPASSLVGYLHQKRHTSLPAKARVGNFIRPNRLYGLHC